MCMKGQENGKKKKKKSWSTNGVEKGKYVGKTYLLSMGQKEWLKMGNRRETQN